MDIYTTSRIFDCIATHRSQTRKEKERTERNMDRSKSKYPGLKAPIAKSDTKVAMKIQQPKQASAQDKYPRAGLFAPIAKSDTKVAKKIQQPQQASAQDKYYGFNAGATAKSDTKVAKKIQQPQQASAQSTPGKQTGSFFKAEPKTPPPRKGADDAATVKARERQQKKEIVAAAAKAGSKSLDKAFKKGMKNHLYSISALEKNLDVFNPTKVERDLNEYVKSLALAVHCNMDSYKETDELLLEYMEECLEIVEMAVDVVLKHGVAFDWCNQVLMTIADTWDNINAVPQGRDVEGFNLNPDERCLYFSTESVFETVRASEYDECRFSDAPPFVVRDIDTILQHAWPLLLVSAADPTLETKISDGELLQMIKDAVDNGVDPLKIEPSEAYSDLDGDCYISFTRRGQGGDDRIRKLYRSKMWSSLPSSKREPDGGRGRFFEDSDDESFADSDDESFPSDF